MQGNQRNLPQSSHPRRSTRQWSHLTRKKMSRKVLTRAPTAKNALVLVYRSTVLANRIIARADRVREDDKRSWTKKALTQRTDNHYLRNKATLLGPRNLPSPSLLSNGWGSWKPKRTSKIRMMWRQLTKRVQVRLWQALIYPKITMNKTQTWLRNQSLYLLRKMTTKRLFRPKVKRNKTWLTSTRFLTSTQTWSTMASLYAGKYLVRRFYSRTSAMKSKS